MVDLWNEALYNRNTGRRSQHAKAGAVVQEVRGMMTLDEIIETKRQVGYTNEDIADMTGVPLSTVQKVFGGTVKAPRRKTLQALSDLFEPIAAEKSMLREEAFKYRGISSAQRSEKDRFGGRGKGMGRGEYTLDDYYAWPDDERIELIDGRIYDMAAPTTDHQLVIGELMWQFMNCQREHGETCRVIVSPVDVQLDCDERTMVQPDIVILCDEEKLIRRCIYGAPDFVLEVLSDSSRSKDMVKKHEKYYEAGCREYWIIDTEKEEVLVSDFEHEDFYNRYTFDDRVPVRISEGRCEIDFRQVRERMI